MPPLLAWLDGPVMSFITAVFSKAPSPNGDPTTASAHVSAWRKRFFYYIHNALASMRIAEMFDVIVDFPDSTPAILDLQVFLFLNTFVVFRVFYFKNLNFWIIEERLI